MNADIDFRLILRFINSCAASFDDNSGKFGIGELAGIAHINIRYDFSGQEA